MNGTTKVNLSNAAIVVNLIITSLLTLGFYFGGTNQKITNLQESSKELKLDVREVRDLLDKHMLQQYTGCPK